MFCGGRGGASLGRAILDTGAASLSLLVNGYDNGRSTGALRRYLPGMLGPSDFRKNLGLHLDSDEPVQRALTHVLEHRLGADPTLAGLARVIDDLGGGTGAFAPLPAPVRASAVRELAEFARYAQADPAGLDLADCALGNLVIAGAYLRLGRDFNAAVEACARLVDSPATLLNVTNGENAYLVAGTADGSWLTDEADIVARRRGAPIVGIDLRSRPEVGSPPAPVTLNPRARDALIEADLIVFGPGTPHSSLLPSYLTPGVADAIAASRAETRVFVVNLRPDHDVPGWSASDLVRRTLAYLGDPENARQTITHVLLPGPRHSFTRLGASWHADDLADPDRPEVHSGRKTLALLDSITGVRPARAW